jgi:hypothetical protein
VERDRLQNEEVQHTVGLKVQGSPCFLPSEKRSDADTIVVGSPGALLVNIDEPTAKLLDDGVIVFVVFVSLQSFG